MKNINSFISIKDLKELSKIGGIERLRFKGKVNSIDELYKLDPNYGDVYSVSDNNKYYTEYVFLDTWRELYYYDGPMILRYKGSIESVEDLDLIEDVNEGDIYSINNPNNEKENKIDLYVYTKTIIGNSFESPKWRLFNDFEFEVIPWELETT